MRGPAFGHPGIEPRWTWSAKDGVGCAYNTGSRVWFTISHGILNELYYPTVDLPQIRDAGLLITDGATFFHEEKRDLVHLRERLSDHALGYRIVSTAPDGSYRIEKEIIAHPHQAAVIVHARLVCEDPGLRAKLRIYALVAPHLDGHGYDDSAWLAEAAGREVLIAHDRTWLAFGATCGFRKRSVGYVGFSDGWQDVSRHLGMEWQFDFAGPGNISLCGELRLPEDGVFSLVLAFGETQHAASNVLVNTLSVAFEPLRDRFVKQWDLASRNLIALDSASHDGGRLYRRSRPLLLAHEDKAYPGAFIASLSIPWGEAKGDDDMGGYHLVWTRDMTHTATALIASGELATPLRALIYLAVSQKADGGFFQNFWIDGTPYWHGVQLDEVAFPILLARRLFHEKALGGFDPLPMVVRAARFLIAHGPATAQERWEENSGYSPSTLAAHIAGLVCAAAFVRESGDGKGAAFIESYADFLEQHVEQWTVTREGRLHPEVSTHYVRIAPMPADDPRDCHGPQGLLEIKNQAEGILRVPASQVIDGGFLELVRYGVRRAGTPLMENTLRVIDHVLKVETPHGASWRRYNHDGYGQRDDGGPFLSHGRGRPWPLLSGERGHYELAAGRSAGPFVKSLEGFSRATGMLPEQIWDEVTPPGRKLAGEPFRLGEPTGAAMPLVWAHAEYIKLLRSARDGRVFDRFDEVADRYQHGRGRRHLEAWKFNRKADHVHAGGALLVIAEAPFRLIFTRDEWQTNAVLDSEAALGLHSVEIAVPERQRAPVRFTFFWPEAQRWEGTDFVVTVHA